MGKYGEYNRQGRAWVGLPPLPYPPQMHTESHLTDSSCPCKNTISLHEHIQIPEGPLTILHALLHRRFQVKQYRKVIICNPLNVYVFIAL